MTISEIKRQRAIWDITQLELGRVSDVNHRRLCMGERGHIDLRPDELESLSQGLRLIMRKRAQKLMSAMPEILQEVTA